MSDLPLAQQAVPYGMKFIVRCTLRTPDKRDPCIMTVWIAETGAYPRLVTAYPSS